MKNIIAGFVFYSLLLIFNMDVQAEEKPERHARTGGHFAVTEFSKEDGFKLSEQSLKRLGISFSALKTEGAWTVPIQAMVKLKHTMGVYRRFDGWIAYVLVKQVKKDGATVTITSEDLQKGDEVAISGTAFLRMIEVDLNTDTVDGCAN